MIHGVAGSKHPWCTLGKVSRRLRRNPFTDLFCAFESIKFWKCNIMFMMGNSCMLNWGSGRFSWLKNGKFQVQILTWICCYVGKIRLGKASLLNNIVLDIELMLIDASQNARPVARKAASVAKRELNIMSYLTRSIECPKNLKVSSDWWNFC